jgi:plastocyanin
MTSSIDVSAPKTLVRLARSGRYLFVACCVLAVCSCNNNENADVVDAGAPVDTGVPIDMGAPIDTGAPVDTGAPFAVVNGCTQASYVDMTAAGASRTITATTATTAWAPNCVTISAGQTVTWNAPFGFHILAPGVAPNMTGTSAPSASPNPIPNVSSGTTASATFTTPGIYGFYCSVHYPLGMVGAIQVL